MAKPGEKRLQILQTLAGMLENPKGEKITTAALAARLECSEAALYRHFASKAQMFDGLIEFIESSLFGVINQIEAEEPQGLQQVEHILALLLNFAKRNRGMTKVLTGDALVNENPRLQARINLLHDKIEASLRQALRVAATQNEPAESTTEKTVGEQVPEIAEGAKFAAMANILLCHVIGRWQLYVKSGFSREPTAQWAEQWPCLYRALM